MTLQQTSRRWTDGEGFRLGRGVVRSLLVMLALCGVVPQMWASIYAISAVKPVSIPAGSGATALQISGTLPNFAQGDFQVCFYAGTTNTALTPAVGAGPPTITVPAATIQGVAASAFTAANNYSYDALVYIVSQGSSCDGTVNTTLTNSTTVAIVEPLLSTYNGPLTVPRTNTSTSVQAPPSMLLLQGSGFTATTYVSFGSFGNVTPVLVSPTALNVPVPAAFAASAVGTTAKLVVCNTSASTPYCNGGGTTVTITVASLVPSVGTVTPTPSPVTTLGTTTLKAQFKKQTGSQLPEPGAPSGTVTFTANSATIGTAPLVVDTTAVFVPQNTATFVQTTATPAISPVAGTYPSPLTVTITDTTPGASIYYTTNGSTPTSASPLYAGPFTIAASLSVKAIATTPGYFDSKTASTAYTIFVPTPTSLAFVQQPTSAITGAAITPPVTVAILDQNNNVITNSTATVTIGVGTNPGQGTLSGTTAVAAVNGIATFSNLSINAVGTGYTLIATLSGLTPATSAPFNITPYPITVTLFDPLIGVGSTLPGSFTLGQAAGANGVTVSLASSAPGNVSVSPATVFVASGQTTGNFTYTGVAAGAANITASAPNYQTGSATVTATQSQVSLGTIPSVAPGQTVSLALSIATPAPAGGVTVSFTSSNTNVATVTSSVFIPAGLRTPAANPQIVGVTIGRTTITATAPGYAPDTRSVNVTVTSSFNPTSLTTGRGTYQTVTLNISAPAQTGGLTFTLSSDDTTKVTVPASITIPASQTSVTVPITGVADGTTTVRANTAGVSEATVSVTVSSQTSIYYGNQTTGVNLQVSNYLYLPSTPPGPLTLTVTSSNPAVATLSKSATVVGTASVSFTNVTSAGNTGPFYIQGQSLGTTTLTFTAPNYTTSTVTITVNPSGFTFAGGNSGGLSTTTFSSPSTFYVYATVLNPGTLTYSTTAQLNPGLGTITVPVTSSNTNTGTITTSPVSFNAGDTQIATSFQPTGAGTTNVSVGAPTPATGFSTPTQYTSFTATVTAPQASFYYGNATTGVNMQVTNYLYLPQTPPGPITLTVTSSNPSVATVSKSATVVGTSSLTYTNVTAAGNTGPIYIQGLSIGTTTFTLAAPGYTSGTITVTVYPSGFTFAGGNSGGLSTTSFSSASSVYVYASILNPGTLTYYGTAQLNPGLGAISVPVTSSNTNVGTITTSPLVFNAGDTNLLTSFQPSSAGTSTIAVGAPTPSTGFSTPAQYTSFTATVTAPQASFYYGNVTTGANLQQTNYLYLPVTPPSAVTETVTSSNPAVAVISKSATVAGTSSLSYTGVTAAGNTGPIYIQGLSVGTTTLTLAVPGYTSGTITVTVYPSGFTFAGSNNGGLSTTTFSTPTTLNVYATILNPGTLTYYGTGQLNPGLTISVPVTSSNTTTGTITASPIVFHAGDTYVATSFQPTSAGTSTIAIGAPSPATGFSTSADYTSFTATVTAPQLSFYYGNTTTGAGIQVTNYAYLPVSPPNAVNVTVTSNGPTIATVSKSPTTVGTTSITYAGVTAAGNQGPIYIQGLSVGSTTLTVSAPGYTNGNITVTVYPSGFTFAGTYNSGLSTTVNASPTVLTVYPSILNPGTLTYYGTGQFNPGVSVSVPVTSSNTNVGAITTSPLVFSGGESYLQTTFKPVGAGTSVINVAQPSGYTTSSQYTQINATVQ